MKIFVFLCVIFMSFADVSASQSYSPSNAHSHNDYEQKFPFKAAWQQGFGSIEADVFLDKGKLIVAHDTKQMKLQRGLDSLYLIPLAQVVTGNNGYVYADTSKKLQLMIDIKTEAIPTLTRLVEILKGYPALTTTSTLKIVISGNRPSASTYHEYPAWILFDGDLNASYSPEELNKIEMMSGNFQQYSVWKGTGLLPENDKARISAAVQKAHEANKKIRFWAAPDNINSWNTFVSLGIDYLNTDRVEALATFLKQYPDRTFSGSSPHKLYTPKYRNDGLEKPVKYVIILIGDGTGLAQWYAGYTANHAALNVFSMRQIGLSKTSSYDSYITDSAPGATALSTGKKTNNRSVGVDHTGAKLTLLPDIIATRKMRTAIVTTGDFRDATPASFYAHRSQRSDYKGMMEDLAKARVDVIMGACNMRQYDSAAAALRKKFSVTHSLTSVSSSSKLPLIVADSVAALSMERGRKQWAETAFDKTISLLSRDKNGFLLMLEGAQIDHGGHANKLPYAVSELLDFDQVIGKAMQFADSNGETLIIVTGDHETGGLTLTGGDYESGMINGQFSTGGHTAIPVPVFAYGPQSQLFRGVYENTEIFSRILKALKVAR
ncbi:alkaline phosphatase [Pollutibacter soli]|uniref:alkaline phosphatase n=1 Tax=Pollutibacter soli TaxID=3034157 RepID=UPI0030135BE6